MVLASLPITTQDDPWAQVDTLDLAEIMAATSDEQLDSQDDEEDEEEDDDVPRAIPVSVEEICSAQQPADTTADINENTEHGASSDVEDEGLVPPPKPARGRPRTPDSSLEELKDNYSAPAQPLQPTVGTSVSEIQSPFDMTSYPDVNNARNMTPDNIRLLIRLLYADGRGAQARELAELLPVDPVDPRRSVDPDVDIFLGYRAVERGMSGEDMWDFFEELGIGYYFYSHRETAEEIGRLMNNGDFIIIRAFIKPSLRRGYEKHEKIRVYPAKTEGHHRKRSGLRHALGLLKSSSQPKRKYNISSILSSSFGKEILIADAAVGQGTQIKLGPAYENYLVRIYDKDAIVGEPPEGGWPIAEHAHTRTHGRLASVVTRASEFNRTANASINL